MKSMQQKSDPQVDHAIVDILIIQNDKFLLVEEGRPGREGLFNLPGGHVEAHETLFDAAIREAKEETGYDIELTGVVGIYQSVYARINVSGPVFSAKVIGGDATSSAEHSKTIWVTKDELRDLAEQGKLFTKHPPLAIGHYTSRGAFPLNLVTCYNYTK